MLNGSGLAGDAPDRISEELDRVLVVGGWHVDRVDVHSARIRPCLACSACAFRRPGECALVDDGQRIPRLMAQADLFAFVCAIRFGGYPAGAKRALERTLPNVHPYFSRYHGEMHHRLRYPRRPFMLFLGWQPGADEEAAILYRRLAERNARSFQTGHRAEIIQGEPDAEALGRQMQKLVCSLEVNV